MPLILCKSCQRRKRNDNEQPAPYVTQTINDVLRASEDSEWQRGRVLINQSLMYMGALFFTWLWFLLHYVHVNIYQLEYMNAIFFPLQGFWNLLIFLYDKTFLLRQTEPELGFFKAVKKILSSPSDAARIVLSDLSNVRIEPRITKQEERISYETSSASKNLSYDSKINLSMYDSISEHRNNMSRTSHVIGNTSHAIANENRSYEYYTDSYE